MARLPPQLSRTFPLLAPDHTWTGAVPVNLAKAPLSRKRWTSGFTDDHRSQQDTGAGGLDGADRISVEERLFAWPNR